MVCLCGVYACGVASCRVACMLMCVLYIFAMLHFIIIFDRHPIQFIQTFCETNECVLEYPF